jgi:hypothetical protein
MDLMDLIGASGGLGQIAQQVGLTPEDAQRGAQAVLPDLVAKVQERALGGGLGGLLSLAGAAQGGAGAGQLVTQLLGSEDALRGLVAKAAQLTGIPAATLEKFVPLLASLVTSTVAKQGNLGDALSGALSGGLGSLLGGGSQGQKEGNPLADVASLAGKLFG